MKRDLRSMSKASSKSKEEESVKDVNTEEVRKKAEELSKLSEGELMGELFRSVDAAKESGDFSEEKVNSFISKVSPMLNKEQRERMNALIDKLK